MTSKEFKFHAKIKSNIRKLRRNLIRPTLNLKADDKIKSRIKGTDQWHEETIFTKKRLPRELRKNNILDKLVIDYILASHIEVKPVKND